MGKMPGLWPKRRGCSEAKITMTMAPRNPTTQIERRIESALAPGRFIPYKVNFEFVRELEAVEKQIARMVLTDPGRATPLYESFLAGFYAKSEEIDDSSGCFGQCGPREFRASAAMLRERRARRRLAVCRERSTRGAPPQDRFYVGFR